MSDEIKDGNATGHGDFERRDIGVAPVLYFLLGLAFAGLVVHFVVSAVYHELEKRSEEQQPAVSPLVKNVPADTRHLPPEYKTDAESTDYEKYLQSNFPAPQLETDERDQLNNIRLHEEQILNTYGYVDQSAGIVRIPIEHAMDLIAQRGLPVRGQSAATATTPSAGGDTAAGLSNAPGGKKTKGKKQ